MPHGDEEAEEQLVVLGADTVGEDAEGCREDARDDQDLEGGVHRGHSAGGAGGGEDGLEGGPVVVGAVLELVPGGVLGVHGQHLRPLVGEGEGAEEGQQGGECDDRAARLQVDGAAEFDADGGDGEPGDGEVGERGEFEGRVAAAWGEPAGALDAVRGEGEEDGEQACDQDLHLEAAGGAVEREVAREAGVQVQARKQLAMVRAPPPRVRARAALAGTKPMRPVASAVGAAGAWGFSEMVVMVLTPCPRRARRGGLGAGRGVRR